MKSGLSVLILAICFATLTFCLSFNLKRLDTAATTGQVEKVEDEADLEGSYNDASTTGNDDADKPTHAITIASESELATLDSRSTELLGKAEAYLKANPSKFTNKNYITAVDFTLHSSKARMYVKDLRSGVILSYHVAHGSGSDPGNTGIPTKFSNVSGSNASSVGYYRVSETYNGKHGLSARLDGLSTTNSKVRSRAVVIHGASYVYTADKKAGRSWGCFALALTQYRDVVTMLKGGSVLYAEGK